MTGERVLYSLEMLDTLYFTFRPESRVIINLTIDPEIQHIVRILPSTFMLLTLIPVQGR